MFLMMFIYSNNFTTTTITIKKGGNMSIILQAAATGEIFDKDMMESAGKLALQVRNVMLNFAPMFVIIIGIWGVIRFYVGYEQGGRINFQKYVVYPLVMLFALIQYAWIMDTINTVAFSAVNCSKNEKSDDIYEYIMNAQRQHNIALAKAQLQYADTVLNKKTENLNKEYANKTDEGLDGIGNAIAYKIKTMLNSYQYETVKSSAKLSTGEDDSFGGIPSFSFNILDHLKGVLQAGMTIFCRTLIIMIRNVLFMTLLVIGPIAMTFDILPAWRGQFIHWLKVYIGVILWGLTINVIDALYVFYVETECKNVLGDTAAMAAQGDYYFAPTDSDFGYMSFVIALMYLFVPYITSLYAGGAGAGKVFTAMAGYAARGVAMTVSGGMSAASSLMSGSSKTSGRTTNK